MKTTTSTLISLALLSVAVAYNDENDSRHLRSRRLTSNTAVSLDPKTIQLKTDGPADDSPSKRKFISYTPSPWEFMWLNNVDKWANDKQICEVLHTEHQAKFMHDFLLYTCSAFYEAPYDNWCVIDDAFRPLWYNTANRAAYELTWEVPVPEGTNLQGPLVPVEPGSQHEEIFSKFVFLDESTGERYTEYIEPLVSHLRWPLAHCIPTVPDTIHYKYHGVTFRGWVVPPPTSIRKDRSLYFDAGASNWSSGSGGPSLKFFHDMWARSGIQFDEIYAFEMKTTKEDFYDTVPPAFREHVHYQQCPVSSQSSEDTPDTPFIPNMIKRLATKDDYVLWKLDIDSAGVENGNVDFILNDPDTHIDEFVWEHHVAGNYLMVSPGEWGNPLGQDQKSLRDSYEYFLRLRQKGIRAHSWV